MDLAESSQPVSEWPSSPWLVTMALQDHVMGHLWNSGPSLYVDTMPRVAIEPIHSNVPVRAKLHFTTQLNSIS